MKNRIFRGIHLLMFGFYLMSCSEPTVSIEGEEELLEDESFVLKGDSISGLAFPSAAGYGSRATGGRGGKVAVVTNLSDDGVGSFRNAVQQYPDDPLTIVFSVGGLIELQSDIKINRSNLTIAGQTALGDGICFSGASIIINGARAISQGGNHGNIIVRYIRSRPGGRDPLGQYGLNVENCHNVIIDHCSFSWANEECVAIYDTKNVTIQWSIVSEGLYDAGHGKGVRSYGGVWGGQYSTFHHNLIANNVSRTLAFNGARAHDTIARIDYRNNVIYNWGGNLGCYGGRVEIEGGLSEINMVNNYYKPGPATPERGIHFIRISHTEELSKGTGRLFLSGNIMHGYDNFANDNMLGVNMDELPESRRGEVKMSNPFDVDAYAQLTNWHAERSYA